jgi:hypothetical protein
VAASALAASLDLASIQPCSVSASMRLADS